MTFWQELKTCKSGRGQRRFSTPWFPLSSWLGHLLHEFSSGEKGKQRKSQLQGELYKISQVSVFMVCFACAGFQATSLVNSINEGYQATINRSNVTESGSCVTTPSGFRRSSKAWVVASIHDYTILHVFLLNGIDRSHLAAKQQRKLQVAFHPPPDHSVTGLVLIAPGSNMCIRSPAHTVHAFFAGSLEHCWNSRLTVQTAKESRMTMDDWCREKSVQCSKLALGIVYTGALRPESKTMSLSHVAKHLYGVFPWIWKVEHDRNQDALGRPGCRWALPDDEEQEENKQPALRVE